MVPEVLYLFLVWVFEFSALCRVLVLLNHFNIILTSTLNTYSLYIKFIEYSLKNSLGRHVCNCWVMS
jgi:hypothetical protein